MRRSPQITTMFVLIAALALTACAQFKALPNLPASHPERITRGPVACSECHEDNQKGTLKKFAAFDHSRTFVQNHRFYAASDDALCASCHKFSFCNDCHANKVEFKPSLKNGNRPDRMMPHRGDYLTLHKIEGKLDPASCYRCHGRANNDLCVACHR
ncbi:MAG TPA: cytochrome C [Geomonas sp.]|nr:cytochrome C [Geomonas sp.]